VYRLLITLALVIGTPAFSAQVTVTRIDGSSVAGELKQWDEQRISVATTAREVVVAPRELLSMRWAKVEPADAAATPVAVLVELTDGSVLPADQFRVTDSQAVVTLPSIIPSDHRELRFPVRQVAAVRLQSLDSELAEQWSEIRGREFASDVLVIFKRGRKSLDYVEGALGEVTEEKIEFKLDGEFARVDRAKVAGLIYLVTNRQVQPEPVCTVHGRTGLRANVSLARLTNGMVSMTTGGGTQFDWPLEDIHFADFSAGKILYLSDIEQATVRWTPLVGRPGASHAAAKYGQPRRDEGAYGGPLTLALHDNTSSAASTELRSYGKGLALHSRTEMIFRLPAGYRQFLTTAGIEPVTSASGNVQFKVYGDEEPLFETSIAGGDAPREIELDVAGVKRLKLVVDFGKNLDTGDWLNLCDARLVK
jgi:hypothetical protein